MKNYKRYVQVSLDYHDGLQLLAEESTELAQAALKMIRACEFSENSTPMTEWEAMANLIEEVNDVLMVLYLLEVENDLLNVDAVKANRKWRRWAKRLGAE